MDLLGLDKDFGVAAYVPYLNLQWNREYYTAGDWEAQIRAEDFNAAVRYVYSRERPEVGIVEKVQTKDSAAGHFIHLSGHFLEGALDWNIIDKRNVSGKRADVIARETVTAYPPDGIPLNVVQDGPEAAQTIDQQWELAEAGTALYEMLETEEMSQRMRWNDAAGRVDYAVWQGLDRTQEQSVNAWALFTDESPFVTEMSVTLDDSGYRNVCRIAQGSTPTWREVDQRAAGEYRRVCGLKADKASQTEAAQKGREELEKNGRVYEADIKVVQKYQLYRTDYDLGDKCDIICHRLGLSFSARITSVHEVFKQGRHEVTLSFGKQSPTAYQKFSRMIRGMR